MKTDLFDFHLPQAQIAQQPPEQREQARLLHVFETGCRDHQVLDLAEHFTPGEVLVFNDTRVIPARLYARGVAVQESASPGTAFEILLHKPEGPLCWRAFVKPARKLRPGQRLLIAATTQPPEAPPLHTSLTLHATLIARHDQGECSLRFDGDEPHFRAALQALGQVPLPPYIARPHGAAPEDGERYQTVYAARDGSVAAPTAGLHFTWSLLEALKQRGVVCLYVTLHVGAGTFQPVKAEDTRDHVMHEEYGELDAAVAQAVNAAKAAGRRVTAVGTTSLRLLESAAAQTGTLEPFCGETNLFITPGYFFRCVDRLLTNFHLPRSTLFMLVCAFSGRERMQRAYRHAIAAGYRFYSYGDACLLERCPS